MANRTGKGQWQSGQSGNPKGRPPKRRVLTEALEKQLAAGVEDTDGTRRARKRIIARALVDLATTGAAKLPGGTKLTITTAEEFMEVWRYLYAQVDGPPKSELGVSVDPITIIMDI
jgi:hypothetical protein